MSEPPRAKPALMPVAEAVSRVLDGKEPLDSVVLPLQQAMGRVLAAPVSALRTQPPQDVSAMDGYAIRFTAPLPDTFRLTGESAAGHGFDGQVQPGEAVRIFTGAPLPAGADTVVIQEEVQREGETLRFTAPVNQGQNVRKKGVDFSAGRMGLAAGRRLTARDIGLAAAMDHASLSVVRPARLGILSTGDELILPGLGANDQQIVASNNAVIAALATNEGAEVHDFGLVPDRLDATIAAIEAARAAGCDVLVTSGGASVGDHDHVPRALQALGVSLNVWKIAMRPGKPFMMGDLGPMRVLGLPGNPVASFVCTTLFLRPLLRRLAGRTDLALETETAILGAPVKANDLREDYLRAALTEDNGVVTVRPASLQDSSLLSVLAEADALILRPPFAPAAQAGERVPVIRL